MNKKNEPVPSDEDVERFNRWAPTYDRSMIQRWFFGPVHAKMIDLLKRFGPKDAQRTIIDVGCGTGRLLQDIAVHWPEADLFGVDPADEMLCGARQNNPKATFMLAPAEALPIPDQTADMVLSSISFHHWIDHHKGIQEVARVLRPGGWFCLADHIFLPARLFGDKVKKSAQIRGWMSDSELTVMKQHRMGIRFVLITLAQKPTSGRLLAGK